MTDGPQGTPRLRAPATLSQAEAGLATATANEREEQRHKAKENLEVGAAVAVFGLAVLPGWLFLPKESKRPGNVRLTVSLLLSFATFLSGKALMLLSLNMLGREDLVSGGHRVAAKCLVAACAIMSVLTLLSLLALLPGRIYLYIALAMVTVIMLATAGAHCYLTRRAGGGNAAPACDEEDKKELDAAWKTTSSLTNSAFGGLVGVLFSASKIYGAAPASMDRAAYAAIFFMFSTGIVGMFVMTVSKKVPKITKRQLLITTIRLANAFLLCSLACAAFAAAFVVLRYRIFAAFSPLVITGILCFLLRHCVVRRGRGGGANLQENQEARLKAMEDIASKVTAATLGAIMSILGGALGEKDHEKWGAMEVFMIVLTSAFMSSFGFMVLASAPGSARAYLVPVARMLAWSTVALFTATAVAAYGVEVWTM